MKKATDTQAAAAAVAIGDELSKLMADLGWSVRRRYVAQEGSVYLQFEQPSADGLVSGKVRIADHEQQSGDHAAPEVEIIYGRGTLDLVAAAHAIHFGEQGQF